MHLIEVDDIIMKYLQKHAEPLIDSANSVLHKLLPQASEEAVADTSGGAKLAKPDKARTC